MEPEEVQPPQEAVEETLSEAPAEAEPETPAAEAEAPAVEAEAQAVEAEAPATEAAPEEAATAPSATAEATETEEEEEEPEPAPVELSDVELKSILEAVIYITEEPLESKQIAQALGQAQERVDAALAELVQEYARPERGLQIREIAGGFKMATKPEHHEAVRRFVKNLKPSLKMTAAALETLAVIAYKQPITAPEIMEIRGVQGAGVLKTLVERKLITTAGRKNVIGKPILYKTTREFLLQFGLKSVNELPTLKEFEELRRLAFSEDEVVEGPSSAAEAAADGYVPPMEGAAEAPAEEPAAEAQTEAPPAETPAETSAEAPTEAQPEPQAETPPTETPVTDTAAEA